MNIATKIFGALILGITMFCIGVTVHGLYSINQNLDRLDENLAIIEARILMMENVEEEVAKVHIEKAMKFPPEGYTRFQLRGFAQTQAQQMMEHLTNHYDMPRYELSGIRFRPALKDGAAGSTDCDTKIISLNEILFLRNYYIFMEEIIPHEVAHVLTCLRYGYIVPDPGEEFWEAVHGEEWIEAMLVLGLLVPEDMRTHSLDLRPVRDFQEDFMNELMKETASATE